MTQSLAIEAVLARRLDRLSGQVEWIERYVGELHEAARGVGGLLADRHATASQNNVTMNPSVRPVVASIVPVVLGYVWKISWPRTTA